MTKEQRLELLKQIEKDIYVPSIESTFLEDAKSCAIHSAIEELDPESKTNFEHKAEIVISQLRADRDRLQNVIDKIKAEIKEWYWQADKQALAKDPCVVDAMIDLFIRTIDKCKEESEKNICQ